MKLKNQGFTLVELMVVVAIIGILSAVAVPQFKKYQAKSKNSEAKIFLSSIYIAETSTYSDFDAYAICIRDIGVEAPTNNYYAFGFNAAANYGTGVNPVANINGCTNTVTAAQSFYLAAKGTGTNTAAVAGDITDTAMTSSTFTATAAGSISETGKSKFTITQTKAITETSKGY